MLCATILATTPWWLLQDVGRASDQRLGCAWFTLVTAWLDHSCVREPSTREKHSCVWQRRNKYLLKLGLFGGFQMTAWPNKQKKATFLPLSHENETNAGILVGLKGGLTHILKYFSYLSQLFCMQTTVARYIYTGPIVNVTHWSSPTRFLFWSLCSWACQKVNGPQHSFYSTTNVFSLCPATSC